MDLGLVGKRALVTGASRGIGLAIAGAFAEEGAHVVLAARDPEALARARSGLGSTPGRLLVLTVDTTSDASVRTLLEAIVTELEGVDIVVNAAAMPGITGKSSALVDLRDEDLRLEVETKVLGYLRTARAAAPHMTAQGWGRIINVSGLAARQTGSVFGSIRNVAVAAMTKNLADELGRSGINVTTVHPGLTVTERTPALVAGLAEAKGITLLEAQTELSSSTSIGRLVTAAEVADVVTFLASPRSVAINGDAIAVGGGSSGTIHY